MARSLDGTNDNLSTANDALAGMNVNAKTFSCWVQRSADPSADQTLVIAGTAIPGTFVWGVNHNAPAASGWRIELIANWTGDGNWISGDISNTPHHIAVSYDRGATTNDPVFFVDGVSVTVTEVSAPSGTAVTGDDTLRLGELLGGTQDLAAVLAHVALDAGNIWTAEIANRAKNWGRPHGGMLSYHSLLSDKLADEGSGAADLTASGTTVANMVTPCVRPGSALMGMGIGW